MYERSEAEKVQKQRNKLRKQIERCFLNYQQIPEKHHYLFKPGVEKLCTTRTPHYLQRCIETFKCHVDQTRRETFGTFVLTDDEKSMGTFDTEDKDTDEYLIDINDGMDILEVMADRGMGQDSIQKGSIDERASIGDGN